MDKKTYCSDDLLGRNLCARFTLYFICEKGLFGNPSQRGGRGGGNIAFFLEVQFTPLSPDISIISVSQAVNLKKIISPPPLLPFGSGCQIALFRVLLFILHRSKTGAQVTA